MLAISEHVKYKMNNITLYRKKLGISLNELAKKTNMDSLTLRNLEVGKKRLNWDILVIIAESLNCMPEELITDSREGPSNNLKILRLKKNMTLRKLAELTGLGNSTLSQIENGSRRLNEDNINIIAQALDCTASDLIGNKTLYLFPNNLKILRIKRNISLAKLGEITGININYLEEIERGNVKLNEELINSLSKALSCSPKEILNAFSNKNIEEISAFNNNLKLTTNTSWLLNNYNMSLDAITIKDAKDISIQDINKIVFVVVKKD